MTYLNLGTNLYHAHILLTVHSDEKPLTWKKLYIYLLFIAHCMRSEWVLRLFIN